MGFWFHDSLDMEKSIKEISKSASRALGAVYMKYLNSVGMAYNVYTKLVESVFEPILFYCSGIWGHNRYNEIDSVLNKACRLYLGVGKMPQLLPAGGIWVGFHVRSNKSSKLLDCGVVLKHTE